MGCSNTSNTNTKEVTEPNIIQSKTITLKFKLSSGEEYDICG